ncbi:MAG: hypothetical protein N2C14_28345 [Planctomycetales bacterium]
MLAVQVDYQSGQATIGTQSGAEVPKQEVLAALESIGYKGTFQKPSNEKKSDDE